MRSGGPVFLDSWGGVYTPRKYLEHSRDSVTNCGMLNGHIYVYQNAVSLSVLAQGHAHIFYLEKGSHFFKKAKMNLSYFQMCNVVRMIIVSLC